MAIQNISYTAIVLDDASHQTLVQKYKSLIPNGWEVIAHHMTICFGGLPEDLKDDLGKSINIKVEEIGASDKAMAVKVSGYYSKNKTPHITLAINPDGGKPSMSNLIEEWVKFSKPLELKGIITEIYH